MNIEYIDIHSHLGFQDYGKDLKEVVERINKNGICTITVGTDLESSRESVKIANENENIFACIGAHPEDKKNFVFKEEDFEKLVKNPKVVAIGECGLDYFVGQESKVESEKLKVISEEEKERQKFEFIKQIEFAVKYNKPLMLHIRDGINGGETSAYEDAYEILKRYEGRARGNMHFFAGNLEWAKKFIFLGFTLSFTGVITFTRQYDEIIKNVPLEMIHAETDAPYVTPVPYRGKRNEPSYVVEVVKKIAEIRNEDLKKVREQLHKNADRVFSINC